MKINTIILENFESHEYTKLNLHQYFNCLVGPTNSGKTAIYNALFFVFFNEWNPEFLRHGCDECKITLVCDDLVIKRIKGKNVNSIELIQNGTSKVFNNFGNTYPTEIKNLFIGSVEDLLICFSPQDISPFLIYENVNVKGEMINKLSGVSVLDSKLNLISYEIRENKSQLELLSKQKRELLLEYKKLRYFNKIELLYKKYKKLLSKYESLNKTYETVCQIKNKLTNVSELSELQGCYDKISIINLDIWESFLNKFSTIYNLSLQLESINFEIESIEKEIINVDQNIIESTEKLIMFIRENKICPLCGNVFSSDSIDHIFKELI